MKQIKNRGWILFSVTSSLFFAFQIAGFALSKTPLLSRAFYFWIILFFGSIIPGFAVGIFIAWILERTKDRREEALFARYEDGWLVEGYRNLGEPVKDPIPPSSIAWLIILVCYVPEFLAYYPATFSSEADNLLLQFNYGPLEGYHYNLHSLLVYMFWDYGREIGNTATGIAMFTAFQMICLSGAFAYCISLIKKMGCRKLWYWVLVAFAALFPYHFEMAISYTKGSLFAASFICAVVLLLYFFRKKRCSLVPEKEDIIYTAFLVPVIGFSKHMLPAIIVLGVLLLVVMIVLIVKQDYDFLICLRVLISTTLSVVIALLLIYGAGKVLDDKMSSVKDTLISDVSLSRPGESAEETIRRDAGYLYLFDESYINVGQGFSENGGMVILSGRAPMYQEYTDLSMMPGYKRFLVDLLFRIKRFPVLNIVFIPGYVIWGFVIFANICWYRKEYYLLIPIAFAFVFTATFLLTEGVVFKYIYPVWALLPFMAASIFRGKKPKYDAG